MKLITVLALLINFAYANFIPNSFRIDFTQSYKSVTGKEKTGEGYLEYKYPGQLLLKEFNNNTIYVSNQKQSWYYTPPMVKGEKGSVQVGASQVVVSKLFDALNYGLKDNPLYKVNKKSSTEIELIFEDAAAKDLNLKSVTLFIKGAATSGAPKKFNGPKTAPEVKALETFDQIESMSMVYLKDAKVVVLKFNKVNDKMDFSKDHFIFNVPPKTEIIKN